MAREMPAISSFASLIAFFFSWAMSALAFSRMATASSLA